MKVSWSELRSKISLCEITLQGVVNTACVCFPSSFSECSGREAPAVASLFFSFFFFKSQNYCFLNVCFRRGKLPESFWKVAVLLGEAHAVMSLLPPATTEHC